MESTQVADPSALIQTMADAEKLGIVGIVLLMLAIFMGVSWVLYRAFLGCKNDLMKSQTDHHDAVKAMQAQHHKEMIALLKRIDSAGAAHG